MGAVGGWTCWGQWGWQASLCLWWRHGSGCMELARAVPWHRAVNRQLVIHGLSYAVGSCGAVGLAPRGRDVCPHHELRLWLCPCPEPWCMWLPSHPQGRAAALPAPHRAAEEPQGSSPFPLWDLSKCLSCRGPSICRYPWGGWLWGMRTPWI